MSDQVTNGQGRIRSLKLEILRFFERPSSREPDLQGARKDSRLKIEKVIIEKEKEIEERDNKIAQLMDAALGSEDICMDMQRETCGQNQGD